MPNDAALTQALRVTGATMIALCVSHVYLCRLLNWKHDVANLSPINAQIFWAHAAFIAIGVGLLGLVCVLAPNTLVEKSPLARIANICFTLCWLSRLIMQFGWFRGRLAQAAGVERALRAGGTLLWVFYCTVFGALCVHQWS